MATNEFRKSIEDAAENKTQNPSGYKQSFIDGAMWMHKKIFEEGITDGYHTMDELYYYRMLYNAMWVNDMDPLLQNIYHIQKSKKHSTGEPCFDGEYFIVQAVLPTGQISNHYEIKYWDLFHCPEVEKADEWDGHTPKQAADRMERCLLLHV